MSVDKKQLKDALLKTLAEKGDYQTILSHLSSEEKEEKDSQFKELIKPMSAVADILVNNAQGAFTEPLNNRIDERTEELRTTFSEQLAQNKEELSQAIKEAFSGRNEEFTTDILTKLADSQSNLSTTLTELTAKLVQEKAIEMFTQLGKDAKLTEEEIEEIIEATSLSVESQIVSIVGQYIQEQGITTDQITDFNEAVKKLLPTDRQITWAEIVGKPDLSQGGTNTNIVRQLITEALASFSGGISDGDKGDITVSNSGATWTIDNDTIGQDELATTGTPDGSKFLRDDFVWTAIPGGGDMLAANNLSDLADAATARTNLGLGTAAVAASTDFAPALGADDNYVTDAEKAALHAAVTVADSAEIDLTLTGQQISAALVASSIDETKLDASVNASLDLADTAVQPAGLTNYFLKTADDTDDITVGATNKFATAAEKTKLGFISVTQAVDLDTMESDIAAKVSKVGTPVNNQIGVWTGDGTIEGDSALTFDTTTDTLSVAASGKIAMGAVNIIDDSAGTTTLSNIDALDATTESTIEAAIDTLANLTSIQGRTITLADAGADAFLIWDDSASAYQNASQADAKTIIGAASDTATGVVELAIGSEVTTGTDATRAITPDALAGSEPGKRTIAFFVSGSGSADTALTTGDDKIVIPVDTTINGMNLVAVKAYVSTVSSSGAPLFQVRRSRRSSNTARTIVDMLSTGVSIDASEFESADAASAVAINTSNDDVQTGDMLHIDCDTAGTGAKGAQILLTFQTP